MTSRRAIRGMRPEDWALVDRACVLARVTPRALLLVAANAAVQDATRSIVIRAAEKREADATAAAEAASPQIALPLAARRSAR